MKTASEKKAIPVTDKTPGSDQEDYWAEALRLSELRYRRLFETAQDGILILDANSGEIMDVNPFLIFFRNEEHTRIGGFVWRAFHHVFDHTQYCVHLMSTVTIQRKRFAHGIFQAH